jgi:hypothetical protein
MQKPERKPAMHRRRVVALALAALLVASCADSTSVGDDSPNVASIRITVASRLITINSLGNVTGGPAILRTNTTANVTATFHQADGVIDPRVTAASFQLNIEMITNAGVTFQRSSTNPFAGTLTTLGAADNVRMRVSLFDVEHQVTEFGPFEMTAIVAN